MRPLNILVCVQHPDHAELLAYNLNKAGYTAEIFTSDDIITHALASRPDMIILGSTFADEEKALISKTFKESSTPAQPLVVCLTTNDHCPLMDSPVRLFIDACLVLPQKPKQILQTIKELFSSNPVRDFTFSV